VRETRSRWGSCSGAGHLAFSWRLILAPEFVLDYVVAHEVAHLKEMNHGVRFWRLCASLTDADPKAARAWLRRHGGGLHAYG
jgi:predicted metal-dependent hydrolase